MKFGEKLKSARVRKDMTQEAVAKQIGVSRQSLSNWENDRTYPDLASVLRLSDLYGLSLDDLLREDMDLRRRMEQRQKRIRNGCYWLHDFAILLIASAIPLAWLEKMGLLIGMGATGILLICAVHWLFVFRLGASGKAMALRSLALVLWFGGWLIRVGSHHEMPAGDILWLAGVFLHIYVDHRMDWEVEFPRHMTAFTGFVLAMVLVLGAIPFVGNSMERGTFAEANPFNSRNYRVAEVLEGDRERIPMVYLGSTSSVYLTWPGEEAVPVGGKFTYINQPEGASQTELWEMIPENDKNLRYRIAVEEDGCVTMACLDAGQPQWKYRLELAPTMGCTILDVLGSTLASVDWYYADSFDDTDISGGLHLRGKGTVKLSVPGGLETVTIYEEFRDGDTVEYGTMTLTKDNRGFVEFYREANQEGGKQTGIYRIPYQNGEFVLVVRFVK